MIRVLSVAAVLLAAPAGAQTTAGGVVSGSVAAPYSPAAGMPPPTTPSGLGAATPPAPGVALPQPSTGVTPPISAGTAGTIGDGRVGTLAPGAATTPGVSGMPGTPTTSGVSSTTPTTNPPPR